jgi:hypothetical protein
MCSTWARTSSADTASTTSLSDIFDFLELAMARIPARKKF